jgi:hypothetical protein
MNMTISEQIAGYEALIREHDTTPRTHINEKYGCDVKAKLEAFHGKTLGGPTLRDIYVQRLNKLRQKATSK